MSAARLSPRPQPTRLDAVIWLLLASAACEPFVNDVEPILVGAPVALTRDSATFDARDVRLTSDGGTWVLAHTEPFVRRFTSQGSLTTAYGRRGRGPTDLLNPWRFVGPARDDGPPLIWDVARRELVAMDSFGLAAKVRSLDGARGQVRADIGDVTFGEPYQAVIVGERLTYAVHPGDITNSDDLAVPTLLQGALRDGSMDTIVDFRTRLLRNAVPKSARLLLPVPLWDVCPDGSVAVNDGSTARTVLISSRGDTAAVVPLPEAVATVTPFSEEDLAAYVRHRLVAELRDSQQDTARAAIDAGPVLRRMRNLFPKVPPRFVRLVCDEVGRVWLERFSLADHPVGYGRDWIVASRDGAVRVARLPAGVWPTAIRAQEIVGIAQDDDGARWPAVLRLTKAVP